MSRILLIAAALVFSLDAAAAIQRHKWQQNGSYLVVEWLRDDILHLEYGNGPGPDINTLLTSSQMVCDPTVSEHKTSQVCSIQYNGPSIFRRASRGDQDVIETKDLTVEISTDDLGISIADKTKDDLALTRITPLNLDKNWKGLRASRKRNSTFMGLGQKFIDAMKNNSTFNWDGRIRDGGPFGNVMEFFNGGMNSNTQIPILYVLGDEAFENYAFFLDNTYRQRWDFMHPYSWQVEMLGSKISFYIFGGPDLQDLRKDYMEIVGHPLVPPKKTFGLWVSEYGYDNWDEMLDKLKTLRAAKFPIDGFLLDSFWFGGLDGTDNAKMGSLKWDTTRFPRPNETLRELKDQDIGIMLIEEPYVGRALPEHKEYDAQGCLIKRCVGCTDPLYIDWATWWGKGGMLDYTNPSCGVYLHERKRQALIDAGIVGHWLDLGEPELYSENAGYWAGRHVDVHNLYAFNWIKGIYEGYDRHKLQQRPFMLSRSGTAGIQRYGTAMWSGDTAARIGSLVGQFANQANMSMSGIDYYGADIGGYRRETLDGNLDELYTQWFAYGMLFDIPGRPHTDNIHCSPSAPHLCYETAPDRIGDLKSNLANVQLRYELIPYLYSLAHRAYLYGEPVQPPPVYYFQNDPTVRAMGHEKMIGRNLLAGIVAGYGERERGIYLPAGTWYDYYSQQRLTSKGQWFHNIPLYRDGIFRLPLYARSGAIIPLADKNDRNNLIARVYSDEKESSFTLYEDDGETIAYQSNAVRMTHISQRLTSYAAILKINATIGDYQTAPSTRRFTAQLIVNKPVASVLLNGKPLTRFEPSELEKAETGWSVLYDGTIVAKSGKDRVTMDHEFTFAFPSQGPMPSSWHPPLQTF
jgi:alpha-glucosidase